MRCAWLALLLVPAACGKGCDPEPLPTATATAPARPSAVPADMLHPAATVERALGLALPERKTATVLPALHLLPHRKLPDFQVERHLVLVLRRDGGRLLEQRFDPGGDDATLLGALRQGHDDWQRRAGVAANRLVLAVDRDVPPELAGRVRRIAAEASQWRVVALARDGEALVEVLLDPPPAERPKP